MATKDLVIIDQNGQESIIPVEEVKKYIAPTATDAELWLFMGLAQAHGLNPLKREIHFVKYGTGEGAKANIIIGYEVYLKRAMATGKLAWWNVEIEGANVSEMKA
ncbi:MAG: recombinase RecT, partial [Candidatus Altiarchaeota archaeon]